MPSLILRSTPARVTAILSVAFFVSLALATAIAFFLIRQELLARIDRSVQDTYSIISQSYGENDVVDLMDSVTSHANSTKDRVFLLLDRSGQVLAGNLTAAPDRDGWSTLPAYAVEGRSRSDYRIYSGQIDGYRLVVGFSLNEADDVGWLVLTSLGWAGAAFVLLVTATGLVVAARGQRRLDSISQTMERIGHGDLKARIPLSRRNDDIDALSTSVNAALERLAALVEGMRQVGVDIAHELKTPLNRLGISLEATVEANERGEPVTALLDQAQAEGRRINATFDALLRIAQIESGARRARFTDLDMRPILETIAEVYAPVAAESGQRLAMTADDPLGRVHGDKDLLTQLIANLVENAIRHCPSGAEIVVSGHRRATQLEILVADTGPGIPEGEQHNVFRRLYRLQKSRTTSGSGLGLSLVKAISDLHGAHIALRDNAPGLIVVVEFPLTPVSSGP
ncbi:MAG: ATP-binding protein [Devosia sp.]